MNVLDYCTPVLERLHEATVLKKTAYIRGPVIIPWEMPAPPSIFTGHLVGLDLSPLPTLLYNLPKPTPEQFHELFSEAVRLLNKPYGWCEASPGLKAIYPQVPFSTVYGENKERRLIQILVASVNVGKLSITDGYVSLTTPLTKYKVTSNAVEFGNRRVRLKKSAGPIRRVAETTFGGPHPIGKMYAHSYVVLTQNFPQHERELRFVFACLSKYASFPRGTVENYSHCAGFLWRGRQNWFIPYEEELKILRERGQAQALAQNPKVKLRKPKVEKEDVVNPALPELLQFMEMLR